jgi:signal transduction histidine kinase
VKILRALAWHLSFAWLLLVFCIQHPAMAQPGPAHPLSHSVLRIESADFQMTQRGMPPATDTPWQPLELPDNWNVRHRGQGGSGWYRMYLSVNEVPSTLHAIYLAHASMSATVFLNGLVIDNSGGLFENGMRNWNRPYLIKFLPDRLVLGVNEILIRVDSEADALGGLSAVQIGPASQLEPTYQWRRLIQLEIPQIAEVVMALICLLTFGFWLLLRDPLYGYFTLAAGARFVRELDTIFNDIALPEGWDQLGTACLVSWFVIFLLLFSIKLLRLSWKGTEKGLLWLALAVLLVLLAFGGRPPAARATEILHVAALVLGLLGLLALIPKMGRVPYAESVPLALAGITTLLFGVHDVLLRLGVYAADVKRLSQLGVPLLICTMALILFSRYVRNAKALEASHLVLEERVAQKSLALVQALQLQHQLQQTDAVLQERELILREMHDGVGNYLSIALRALSRTSPDLALLQRTLKDCMLDVRLMIDSLGDGDSGADTVATVLGNLRYRMEPALKSEGIQLVWNVVEIHTGVALTTRNILNLTRIFQEALTNMLKHAGATQAEMRSEMVVRDGRSWAMLALCDNGQWRAAQGTPGHGMQNMGRRAAQLGGQLCIQHTAQGSRVELLLPVAQGVLPSAG